MAADRKDRTSDSLEGVTFTVAVVQNAHGTAADRPTPSLSPFVRCRCRGFLAVQQTISTHYRFGAQLRADQDPLLIIMVMVCVWYSKRFSVKIQQQEWCTGDRIVCGVYEGEAGETFCLYFLDCTGGVKTSRQGVYMALHYRKTNAASPLPSF